MITWFIKKVEKLIDCYYIQLIEKMNKLSRLNSAYGYRNQSRYSSSSNYWKTKLLNEITDVMLNLQNQNNNMKKIQSERSYEGLHKCFDHNKYAIIRNIDNSWKGINEIRELLSNLSQHMIDDGLNHYEKNNYNKLLDALSETQNCITEIEGMADHFRGYACNTFDIKMMTTVKILLNENSSSLTQAIDEYKKIVPKINSTGAINELSKALKKSIDIEKSETSIYKPTENEKILCKMVLTTIAGISILMVGFHYKFYLWQKS